MTRRDGFGFGMNFDRFCGIFLELLGFSTKFCESVFTGLLSNDIVGRRFVFRSRGVLNSGWLHCRRADVALLDQFLSGFGLLSQQVSLNVFFRRLRRFGLGGWPAASLTIAFVPSSPCLLLGILGKRIELLLSWWPATVDG